MSEYVFAVCDERIGLCLLEPERDEAALVHMMNDVTVTHNLMRRLPITWVHQREWLERQYQSEHDVVFGIVLLQQAEQPLAGTMGLHEIDYMHGTATTGTVLLPAYQGIHVAPHAKMLLLWYAFHHLNLECIQSRAYASNIASIRANERCGYREVGRLPGWLKRGGVREDEVILAVQRQDWEPLWEQFAAHRDITKLPR